MQQKFEQLDLFPHRFICVSSEDFSFITKWLNSDLGNAASNEIVIADERRPTVNELANQKGVGQRASGWKLQLFAAEFEALVRIE